VAPSLDVLLVDDSAVVRGLIQRGLAGDEGLRVVGAVSDGQQAVDFVRARKPDVVLLDVEMPVMDGLAALPKILALSPRSAVIMASALTRRHAGLSFRALQLGAADYVPKPDAADGSGAMPAFLLELKAKIKAHAKKPAPIATAAMRPPQLQRLRPAAIAIASSTGGPPALLKIFSQLKGAITTPVFITQHMPATFTAMLAEQLGNASGAPAFEAAEGMTVLPGRIYVAPGGAHMLVERKGGQVVIRLSSGPEENFVRPAADPMLRSLAKTYGPGVLAVILTGMGRDGASGSEAVCASGGAFFTQDEASSVVWGMPGAAYKTGKAMAQAPLACIAPYLADCMRGQS
jgi:two-component system chemotaxis response regulator CheB